MRDWEAIQKTLGYIEENLGEKIETAQLAAIASLSPLRYRILFYRLAKKTVREYIKQRRLARACELLEKSRRLIPDLAPRCGFGSYRALAKAFWKAYGITPEQYCEHPVKLHPNGRPGSLLCRVMDGVPLTNDGCVLEFNRKTLEEPFVFMGVTSIIPIINSPCRKPTGDHRDRQSATLSDTHKR